ncbi:MAG TPA: D-aminoacylase [Acidobacteriota bacterium]|nr:D-aminoacylase [Acidobacteriota bacterium]
MRRFHTSAVMTLFVMFALAAETNAPDATLSGATKPQTSQPAYDLIIRGGRIVDGAGNPWFSGDVAVSADRIAKIGKIDSKAKRIIDARGLVVCPGFIDMHSHSDTSLLVDGNAESKIRQGVTTEILGEDRSVAPMRGMALRDKPSYGRFQVALDWHDFDGYFAGLLKKGISVNVGSYVAGGQLRLCVMGADNRPPSAKELEEMKALVDQSMRQGALGLSTGMIYPPNSYASTNELIELARVAAKYGGIYASHIRNEGNTLMESLQEAITIGEKAGLPVQIFHFKVAGENNWGRMPEAVKLIEAARARGIDVHANQYPYIAGMTGLSTMLPQWAQEGGTTKMVLRLKNAGERQRIRKDIEAGNNVQQLRDWDRVLIAETHRANNKQYEGHTLAETARMRGQNPVDAIMDLLLEEDGIVGAIFFIMKEEDVRYAMQQPWVSVGSDGTAVKPEGVLGQGKPHPRWYGTFPRILGKYVRDEKVLKLEDAVRKMTSLGAQQLGIRDRGLLREGKFADIVVFDPDRVADRATFAQPHQYPVGIEYVIVNGGVVIEKGKHTGARPGKIVYGPGRK